MAGEAFASEAITLSKLSKRHDTIASHSLLRPTSQIAPERRQDDVGLEISRFDQFNTRKAGIVYDYSP
jgi:hypothetical protein